MIGLSGSSRPENQGCECGSPKRTSMLTEFESASTNELQLALCCPASRPSLQLRASVLHTDARSGYGHLRTRQPRLKPRSSANRHQASIAAIPWFSSWCSMTHALTLSCCASVPNESYVEPVNRSGQALSIGTDRGNETPGATWWLRSRPRNRNWARGLGFSLARVFSFPRLPSQLRQRCVASAPRGFSDPDNFSDAFPISPLRLDVALDNWL